MSHTYFRIQVIPQPGKPGDYVISKNLTRRGRDDYMAIVCNALKTKGPFVMEAQAGGYIIIPHELLSRSIIYFEELTS